MKQPFVTREFNVPERLEHAQFTLRPLRITDVVKDYDAVMTSVAHLHGVFGPGNDWPRADLSFEQDLIDLGWHHAEFQMRRSFAYTVMNPDESLCLGCVYIYPTSIAGFDAEAYAWVRASHAAALDGPLLAALRSWLKDAWPFRRVALPGRDQPWEPV
ncbi:MAG: GNAT family N-acetyltransferase [Steroidobacterales bacterium]